MKLAVVGGALQGVEVAYLARKAGFEVILIDRKSMVPARGLCDHFQQIDILDAGALDPVLQEVDLVFPALESQLGLAKLHGWAGSRGIPIVHDPDAYAISSSKIASEAFFCRCGFPVPESWPDCRFPVIAKPSRGSGSAGIRIFATERDMQACIKDTPASEGWLVQEFLDGPSYSVEVMRTPGCTVAFQVTDLQMDDRYDCKRVLAPSALPPERIEELKTLSINIADALDLLGLIDVEVILSDETFKVLEIDARFPSQTPITVYWSCGINMVHALARCTIAGDCPVAAVPSQPGKGTVLEHIEVSPGKLSVTGERVMAHAGPLDVRRDFFGADEALTNYAPGKMRWVATLICTGTDAADAWQHRDEVISAIRRHLGPVEYSDPSPQKVL
ncbi:MAG: 3-methylornithine--L-lysine ligase PylC [Deltaproteobacteria bacterium]|nr:3-methylornithine--L-lysine ligase PylC [Deltaproteobacteria bacterium]MBW2070044.1 3-methylornithine--L-lysine ligase PylC [Deltaproteobacteria bacterium]